MFASIDVSMNICLCMHISNICDIFLPPDGITKLTYKPQKEILLKLA